MDPPRGRSLDDPVGWRPCLERVVVVAIAWQWIVTIVVVRPGDVATWVRSRQRVGVVVYVGVGIGPRLVGIARYAAVGIACMFLNLAEAVEVLDILQLVFRCCRSLRGSCRQGIPNQLPTC